MKILTVGYLHGAGGAERQIVLLSNQLAYRGHDVTLCILSENRSLYYIDKVVNVIDLSKKEGRGYFRIVKRCRLFRQCVKRVKPDIIINYNLQSAYFCLTLSPKTRGKTIYSERGDPYDVEYSGLLGKVRDVTVRYMDGLVFQSEGARDFFSNNIRKKSIVIHNSVNVPIDKFPIPIIRDKRIVNVGRFHPQKNQKLLIEAFAYIAKDFPDYKLELYGEGILHDELQKQICQFDLADRICLIPSRSDLWNCICNAALFVLTSDFEGMPNALMEAMALGLPCISTDCRPGGARSLIEDGVNGFIVPKNDLVHLVEKMRYILEHPDVSEQISNEARRIQYTHSEEAVFDKWNVFLSEL